MKIWNSVFFIAFLFLQTLAANNETSKPVASLKYDQATCTLAPPSDLHVEEVSASWANLAWTAVPGADKYLIRSFDRVTGLQVHVIVVPGTSTSTQISWPDNSSGQIESRAWSIDVHGVPSPSNYTLNVDKIILELVATGLAATNPTIEQRCTLTQDPNNGCSNFGWSSPQLSFVTWYKAYKNLNPDLACRFTLSGYTDNTNIYHVRLDREFANGITFETDGIHFIAKKGQVIFSTLNVSVLTNPTPNGKFYRSDSDDFTFTIQKTGMSNYGRPSGNPSRGRDNESEQLASIQFTATPNPFQDLLTVQLPESTANTNIHLYDLLGSVQRTYTASAVQQELSLNTTDLVPGVYFLRIESGGHVETIKVLKTQ